MAMVYMTAIKIHISVQLDVLVLKDLAFVNDLRRTNYICFPNWTRNRTKYRRLSRQMEKEVIFVLIGNGWIGIIGLSGQSEWDCHSNLV